MIFDFNSSERRGLMLLTIIIVSSISFKIFMPLFVKTSSTDFAKFKSRIKEFELSQIELERQAKEFKLLKQKTYTNKYPVNYKKKKYQKKQIKYYKLNPNKASISDWKKFGFSEKQSKVIYNYIKKSGGISNKSQLKNIFVINNKKYNEIEPYIIIDKNEIRTKKKGSIVNKKNNSKTIIEVNTASKEVLMSISGIGEKISDRIIKYRKLLGGFYSKEQLKEVYGISPETFDKIKNFISVDKNNISKININFSDEKDLYSHPYISYKEAKAIVQYRNKTGFIKNTDVLILKKLLDNNKALPYLVCQD